MSSSFCHFRVPSADGIRKKMRRKKEKKKNMRCSFCLLNLKEAPPFKNTGSVDVLQMKCFLVLVTCPKYRTQSCLVSLCLYLGRSVQVQEPIHSERKGEGHLIKFHPDSPFKNGQILLDIRFPLKQQPGDPPRPGWVWPLVCSLEGHLTPVMPRKE